MNQMGIYWKEKVIFSHIHHRSVLLWRNLRIQDKRMQQFQEKKNNLVDILMLCGETNSV